MKRVYTTLTIAAMVVACAGVASASVWTGGGADNEFSTTNNWNDFGINGTQDINGSYTVERVVDNTCQRTFIRGGAVLNVTGGAHNDNRSGASIYNFLGNGSAGTVNQSGGTYQIGHSLRIGGGNTVNSDGAYNLTDGFLSIYRGSNSAIDSSNPGGRPSMEVGSAPGNAGKGLFEISGGAMETRGGVHIGQDGTFSVVGSAATSIGIGSNQSADGVWIQTSNAVLKVAVDAGGLTQILVDEVDVDGGQAVDFREGSLLDVGYDAGFSGVGTWTVMVLENADIVDGGLGFAPGVDTGVWSYNIDNSGTDGILTVTAIPEPATLGLLGIAGLAIYAKRRFLK